VGNEENKHPVYNPNRTMINITNEFSDVHKKTLKEEIMDITEKLMEKLQEQLKRKYKMHSGNINTQQIKTLRHRNN
jgi:hypothetical protein